jgi:hypothetical protein
MCVYIPADSTKRFRVLGLQHRPPSVSHSIGTFDNRLALAKQHRRNFGYQGPLQSRKTGVNPRPKYPAVSRKPLNGPRGAEPGDPHKVSLNDASFLDRVGTYNPPTPQQYPPTAFAPRHRLREAH